MNKISRDQKGFSSIEIVLVIVIALIIGTVGFLVYKHGHKSISVTVSKSSNVSANSSKSYCDTNSQFCFNYPSSWVKADLSIAGAGTAQIIDNPSKTASLSYINTTSLNVPTSEDTSNPALETTDPNTNIDLTNPINFYTVAILNTDNSKNYQIVSGYMEGTTQSGESNNIPVFFVTDASTASKLNLKAGGTTNIQLPMLVANKAQSGHTILFAATPITNKKYDSAQATAWLSSSDAKAFLATLKSFKTQ